MLFSIMKYIMYIGYRELQSHPVICLAAIWRTTFHQSSFYDSHTLLSLRSNNGTKTSEPLNHSLQRSIFSHAALPQKTKLKITNVAISSQNAHCLLCFFLKKKKTKKNSKVHQFMSRPKKYASACININNVGDNCSILFSTFLNVVIVP